MERLFGDGKSRTTRRHHAVLNRRERVCALFPPGLVGEAAAKKYARRRNEDPTREDLYFPGTITVNQTYYDEVGNQHVHQHVDQECSE